jgi:hypothetical protein
LIFFASNFVNKTKAIIFRPNLLPMTIGILKEPDTETRVSLLPEAASSLTKQNIIVQLEKDAGALAYASDKLYQTKNIIAVDRLQVLVYQILFYPFIPCKGRIFGN